MYDCAHYQGQLLEHLYGLLDEGEGRVLFTHLDGWLHAPCYRHFFGDQELLERARALGANVHFPDIVIEHLHPDFGKAPREGAYVSQAAAHYTLDQATYRARAARGCELLRPPGDVAVGAAMDRPFGGSRYDLGPRMTAGRMLDQ